MVDASVVFVADMDGTLTPARLPMTKEFSEFFESFVERNIFYIVTGSDLKKVQEQVPEKILNKMTGVYCSLGNEFYQNGRLVYKKEFSPSDDLIDRLNQYRLNTQYPGVLYQNYIECRIGMVNFSPIGRDCPQSARDDYKRWDDVHHERAKIAQELSETYPQYDISLGGNISIDIVPHGFGKEQVATQIRGKYPNKKIVFIGDRTEKGGNDYPIARAVLALGNGVVVPVGSDLDTLKFLKEL
jgi:phosphomannomutase